MSEKKRSKRRKDEYTGPGGVEEEKHEPTKQEFKIAKWLKKNVPTKKTKFLNHNVEYFTSSKALDALMASKFAQGDNCFFLSRGKAVEYLDMMLVHKFFHRAKKVPVTESELKRSSKKVLDKEKDGNKEKDGGSKEKEGNKDKEDDNSGNGLKKRTIKNEEKGGGTDGGESSTVLDAGGAGKLEKLTEKDGKEKKKRKIRLDMHPDQVFIDGPEAYVWLYDPIPMHYWLFGALLVVGAIVLCLFPLWPPSLRKGVYYLSVAAAAFLVFILGLTVIRGIVFCVVWVLSASRHHLWLFPNLTEDVGFFASFWPLYQHEYKDGSNGMKDAKKKKRKKDKDSDAEDGDGNQPLVLETSKIENIKENITGSVDTTKKTDDDSDKKTVEKKLLDEHTPIETVCEKTNQQEANDKEESQIKLSNTPSESESESSQRSSTGKDFEIVDTDDVEAC